MRQENVIDSFGFRAVASRSVNAVMWHVSSSLNRASIEQFGLDWTRMGAAPGIAGSQLPELDGIFLGSGLRDVVYFAGMNRTGGPVDAWAVRNVDSDDVLENVGGGGYLYLPRPIAARDIELRYADAVVDRRAPRRTAADVAAVLDPFRYRRT